MKQFIFLLAFLGTFFSLQTCDTLEKICPDITYKHRVMMYVKLKEGMSLHFNSLDSLAFLPFNTSYNSTTYSMGSNILSSGGKADYLYPGTIKDSYNQGSFPIYDSIYNQSAYEAMCNEIGDNINEKFCYYDPPQILVDPSYLNLYFGALYNKLDSIKIICTDKAFGQYPQGISLNDTFNFSCIVLDPKVPYSWGAYNRLPSADPTQKPYYVDAKLSNFFEITGGTRFVSIVGTSAGFSLPSSVNRINRTSPRIYLSGEGRANKEAYRFKLFFYMDDGKLVVESNEIVGYY